MRSVTRLPFILGLLLSVASVSSAQEAALLQRAAWLAGCWGMNDGAVHSTEIWMEPAGGVMLGMSRTVEGGEAEGEFLEISIDGQHLVYTAIPEGQAETAFISTEISDTLIEFENAEHDFPQRIIYRRYSPDSLVARIEGDDEGGLRAYEYPMRRMPCPGTKAPPLIGSALIKGHDVLFGDEVDAYERSDVRAFPGRGGILFVGSSIIRMWADLASQMAPLPVLNRGIGGSRTWDQLAHFRRLVLPYAPNIVVYYCGSNDINNGEFADAIVERIRAFSTLVSAELPRTRLVLLSVIKAPQKRARWSTVDSVNAALRRNADGARVMFVDLNPIFFSRSGESRSDLFEDDQLHLLPQAYEECALLLHPLLRHLWTAPGATRDGDGD